MLKDLLDQISSGSIGPAPYIPGAVTVLSPEDSRRMAAFLEKIKAERPIVSPPTQVRLLTAEEVESRPCPLSRLLSKASAKD